MAMEKTFNAAEAEDRIYKAWEESGAFMAGANASRDEAFSIMIPPPNVTGSLHVGHAFNNTLQDILVRWKRMQGYDTLWQPGTDHAGIATQLVTEREMAANQEPSRREMGREAFIERVWQQKVKTRGTIIGQLKRLGASCDWSREAFTMGGAAGDPDRDSVTANFHDAVIKVFVDMFDKGLIYRGKRLVNWDPHFETAISDLEVENIEVAGHMWHFKYPLAGGETYTYVEKDEDGNVVLEEERDYISIATTRPETMLGDGAVAVHPSDERYAPIVGKLCIAGRRLSTDKCSAPKTIRFCRCTRAPNAACACTMCDACAKMRLRFKKHSATRRSGCHRPQTRAYRHLRAARGRMRPPTQRSVFSTARDSRAPRWRCQASIVRADACCKSNFPRTTNTHSRLCNLNSTIRPGCTFLRSIRASGRTCQALGRALAAPMCLIWKRCICASTTTRHVVRPTTIARSPCSAQSKSGSRTLRLDSRKRDPTKRCPFIEAHWRTRARFCRTHNCAEKKRVHSSEKQTGRWHNLPQK